MDLEKYLSPSRWFQKIASVKETIIITLFGWIPLAPGILLRRLLYPLICMQFGKRINIRCGVELVNANRIEIGNDVTIDKFVRIRNVNRTSQVFLGDHVFLHRGVDLKVHSGGSGKFEIGERTTIGLYSCLSGRNIKIGKYCMIAPHVGIFANNHIFTDTTRKIKQQGNSYQGIVIEDDCWLGKGVTVTDGVTIGEGSVIGAGAVVTTDIPPYSIAVGVPAKVISQRKVAPEPSFEAISG
ncbi:DapH/DapD/GlmU-related protein [Lyngbya aestuarii]|uniref:DapH/DapD/GlmU-related protein n=1 Tax=Lyngbya aestuarii TaxID=118322 RepID=UPI00403D9E25